MYDLTSLAVYLHEINQQIDEYIIELNELATLEELHNRDYYATERLLQVLIEACIGMSKHWLKFLGKTVPNDAYKSFELLSFSSRRFNNMAQNHWTKKCLST
ncbi:MAG: HepT-like ribonuclease domain-containing protein [Methylococcaceae bacterium]